MDSCFPKFKRPESQTSSSGEEQDLHPLPMLIRNFNSLYSTRAAPPLSSPELHYGSTAYAASTPDLSAVYASQRFFISSPGQSNSIIDSLGSSSSSLVSDTTSVMKNSVAVLTHSPDPYADFRQSMEEMLKAHESIDNETSNWEYLHELLLCYMALNPETTHKFIIGAFADLVVDHVYAPAAKRTGEHHMKACGKIKRYRLK